MNLTKSKTAKLAAGVVGFAMVVSAFMPVLASADTASDLQAQINSLLATISSLQAQLSATAGGSSAGTGYTFNTNLTVGSTGTDVMNLQKVLNMSADTKVAASGTGSPGNESTYFGALTRAAVAKFQVKNGISPAAGYVGPITRAKLNTMGGTVVPPVVTPGNPQGGSLSVSAGVQPMNSLAPSGAARVPFTRIVLTAGSSDVTVNSITVQRSGLAQDVVFSGVALVDSNNVQIGTAKTFNSNHQAMVGEPWVIRAGTSQTVTVTGNMVVNTTGTYAGQVAALDVIAVNTSASVSGSFPITGAQQTINATLAIGSVSTSTSAFDPGTTQTKNIGDTGIRVSGVKFTANSVEDLRLFSIRWRQVGTASSVDVSNVVTVVDGTKYPTTVSSDGKYYTSVFPGGLLIPKGNSIDVHTEADVTGSNSNLRTFDLDIDKVTDVYFVGQTFGYGVAPSGTFTPWYNGFATTINAGTVTTISKANEVASQNITTNVNNQVLGGFATNFAGESASISGLVVTLSTTSATTGLLTSVSIVDSNGAVVAGPVDATVASTYSTTGDQIATFTDSITFPIGRRVYTVKGKLPSTASNGAVITAKVTPSGWTNPTGSVSGATIDLSGSGLVTMNTVTVKGAALAVNISATPSNQNVVGGASALVIANYQLDASQSGEDVRLNALPVVVDATGTWAAADLTGCILNDGTTPLNTGSRTVNSLTDNVKVTFSFDNQLIVSKGTVKTLTLTCNLAASPTATAFTVQRDNTTSDYSVTGVTSGSGVTPTFGSATVGGVLTVGNGSLTASIDSSSPAYTLAAGGTAGQVMSIVKLRATNENVNLNKIGLVLTAVTTGNSTNVAGNLSQVYLYDGATLIGTAIFPSGGTVATSTLTNPLVLTKDTDKLITVKADLADVGTSQPGTEGDLVKVNLDSTEGSGQSSGSTVRTGAATGAAGVRMFNTFPVMALDTLGSTGIGDGRLLRFKVTADSHGDVGIFKFNFTLATTTLSVSNIGLFAYTDNGYSSPMSGNFATGGTSASGQIDENLATTSGVCTGLAKGTLAGSFCDQNTTQGTTALTIKASTNPVEVPAGTTRYFELRGSVTAVASGAATVTKLLSDTAIATGTPATITAQNFIWSPNATTTAGILHTDWTSGFGIVGFPTSGLLQSRGF